MSVPDASEVRPNLHRILKERAAKNNGTVYIKSNRISGELGSSAKQVGVLMSELADGDPKGELDVSRWGKTSGIKWQVILQ